MERKLAGRPMQVAPCRSQCRAGQGERGPPPTSLSSPCPGHLIFSSHLDITWSFPLATSRTFLFLSIPFFFLILPSTPSAPFLLLLLLCSETPLRRSPFSPSPSPHPFSFVFLPSAHLFLSRTASVPPRHYHHHQRHHQHPANR